MTCPTCITFSYEKNEHSKNKDLNDIKTLKKEIALYRVEKELLTKHRDEWRDTAIRYKMALEKIVKHEEECFDSCGYSFEISKQALNEGEGK